MSVINYGTMVLDVTKRKNNNILLFLYTILCIECDFRTWRGRWFQKIKNMEED
jgi:hypothetical protein